MVPPSVIRQFCRRLPSALLGAWILAVWLIGAGSASAATAYRTWTGGSTTTHAWSDASNWGGTAPSAGDALVFAGTTRRNTWNDYAGGTSFDSIAFTSAGFNLSGAAVTLRGGAAALNNHVAGANTLSIPLTFSTTAPTITCLAGGQLNPLTSIRDGLLHKQRTISGGLGRIDLKSNG